MSEADPPTATPPLSSWSASRPIRRRWDGVLTLMLLGLALCLMGYYQLGILLAAPMAQGVCDIHPLTCDEALMADPRLDLLRNTPWMAFCGAVILSIVFWKLRWYAFVVPLVCCVVIFVSADVWNRLIQTALGP